MKRLLPLVLVATLASSVSSFAGTIENACNSSDRSAANRQLCGCIQDVADLTLESRSDQSMAASFFRDPHKAQEIRQSDRSSHETFWQRYKNFGRTAEVYCRG
ncbi:hypothetical protein [Halocynthiibacter namhaensis]|uniref:hypothetical protein n=1 Tax=Halocynthiibacter namhaensis TaxID=1290553 RepID=UPI000691424A|nr:hypothetical protein [Halocynthiibacter namhaensis]